MKPTAGSYNKKNNLKMTQGKTTYTSKMINQTSKIMTNSLENSQYRRMNALKQATQSRVNTIKVSVEKAQQLGDNQYKKAMKHMNLMNSLQKQSRQKQHDSLQIITQEHTFKPKINTKSQLNYLYQGHSLSAEKIHFLKNTGEQDRERNQIKFYDRLMKWGKTQVDKRRDQFIRLQTGRESIEKPEKVVAKKPAIFIDNMDMDQSVSIIAKNQQNHTLASSQSFYETPKKHLPTTTPRPYINGEQKFYQKQAKATAIKNGETYYYNNSTAHRNYIHHDDLNSTR